MAEEITGDIHSLDLEHEPTPEKGPTPRAELEATIQSLVQRGKRLHDEVETYVAAVLEKQKVGKIHNPVEYVTSEKIDTVCSTSAVSFLITIPQYIFKALSIANLTRYRNLRNDMRNELAFLQKLAGSNMDEEKARHYIVSSNLLYYEALWSAAKRSHGLQSFRKYFFWDRHTAPAGKHTTKGLSLSKGSQTKNKTAALVDIVAEEGSEWIRVSTVSEKRILFDLAKLGWVNDPDSDEDEDMLDARPVDDDEDDEDQVDVVRNARQLARAAQANPIRGRPPKVRFVLTRVEAGKSPPIDNVINKIRATGAIVQCGDDIPPASSIDEVLPQLLIDRSRALSNTLNIDCTILLALISDISHTPCPILDWYPGEVRAQIQEEVEEHLLPTHLYPAIQAHPMVCTREAADQMNLIVQTLATDTEKLRADLLLGQGDWAARSSEELVAEWVRLFISLYGVIALWTVTHTQHNRPVYPTMYPQVDSPSP